MRLFYSEAHAGHDPRVWLERGVIWEGYLECPARAYAIRDAVIASGLGMFEQPFEDPDISIASVHTSNKISFLRGNNQDILVTRKSRPDLVLEFDEALPLSRSSYEAAHAAASCALSGASVLVEGKEGVAYALCRPPGHHATREKAGGYCLFNNAAMAAKRLLDMGGSKVAVLDIDIHHGNGTQEIIYDEPGILFASLNGANTYPHNDEKNRSDLRQNPTLGTPRILNISIGPDMDDSSYLRCVDYAVDWIKSAGAEAVVVSAGFDTSVRERKDLFVYEPDFDKWEKSGLTEDCYYKIGQKLLETGLPLLAVQEGGYNTECLGQDVAAFLHGLSGR